MSVRQGILERFPLAQVDVAIVWVDILPTDDAAAAQEAAKLFEHDARVSQFHDPGLVTSAAFVDGLIAHPPAWDMYLFFARGETWRDAAPRPAEWLHQLGGGRGPPERFRTGDDLTRGLTECAARFSMENRPRIGAGSVRGEPTMTPHEETIARENWLAHAAALRRLAASLLGPEQLVATNPSTAVDWSIHIRATSRSDRSGSR